MNAFARGLYPKFTSLNSTLPVNFFPTNGELEDLEKIERGENILGKYGYGARGKIARGVAFESLANDIELAAAKDMTDYMTEAQNNDYDYETDGDEEQFLIYEE